MGKARRAVQAESTLQDSLNFKYPGLPDRISQFLAKIWSLGEKPKRG